MDVNVCLCVWLKRYGVLKQKYSSKEHSGMMSTRLLDTYFSFAALFNFLQFSVLKLKTTNPD